MSVDGADLGGATITVRRPNPTQSEDDYGNIIEGAPTEFQIPGCALQPMVARNVTSESLTGIADIVTSRWRLFLPYGADLRPADQVVLGNLLLDVDGDVMSWSPDDFGEGHCETYLIRKEG